MSSCWPDACPSGYARTLLGFKGNSRGKSRATGAAGGSLGRSSLRAMDRRRAADGPTSARELRAAMNDGPAPGRGWTGAWPRMDRRLAADGPAPVSRAKTPTRPPTFASISAIERGAPPGTSAKRDGAHAVASAPKLVRRRCLRVQVRIIDGPNARTLPCALARELFGLPTVGLSDPSSCRAPFSFDLWCAGPGRRFCVARCDLSRGANDSLVLARIIHRLVRPP